MAGYTLKSRLASVWRVARTVFFLKRCTEFVRLPVVAHYVARAARHDLFYHLTHRHYLATFLTLNERAELALFHMRVEDRCFDDSYKHAVYLNGGLQLWERVVDGMRFHIRLRMASRVAQEGDLEVVFSVDRQLLHSFRFTWLDGAAVDMPGTVIPWVTCCQGRTRSRTDATDKFNTAFPNNWPKLFCMAALRGLASANGSEVLIGISGHAHAHLVVERAEQFFRTYDQFWQSLHGEQTSRFGYLMPSRLDVKDLSTVPAKHRKRAEQRRQHWMQIEEVAAAVLRRYLIVTTPSGELMV